MKKYIPISCSFHDVLLAKATTKQKCKITYRDDNTENQLIDVIVDVYTDENSEEFLVTKTGIKIRLDNLIRVDDSLLSDFDDCSV